MAKKDRPKPGAKQSPLHSLPGPGGRQRLRKASAKAVERALMEKAQEMIDQTPEVRAEKVAALKAAVEQGTYQIDPHRLADIILALILTEE
jgi:flagellar biosynthesis anti-sigma factor FlgM